METRPNYSELYFGKSDSKNEVAEDRDNFIKSFIDLDQVTKHLVAGSKTLVLGPKGTGKSALAWYLAASQHESDYVCVVQDASELPLADIPNLETGQTASTERTVAAWKFILLSNYLMILLKDQACTIPDREEVKRVTRLLKQYGFMGDTSGRAILNVSKTTVEIPIPKIGTIYKRENETKLTIYSLLPYLEEWACNSRSPNRHILILDGLDSIFLNDARYDESLASLVQAAYSLNQKFLDSHATGSVVLLLRHDVFNRVSLILPDSQKMRDDFAVELDWRVLSGAAGVTAPLLKLVNEKAAQAIGIESLEVLSYFPETISLGGNAGQEARRMVPLEYLLNLTRHTPRDLLRLFEEIRKVEATQPNPSAKKELSQDVIREGVLKYSSKYFAGAILNEFVGYEHGPEEVRLALEALRGLERQTFDRDTFASRLAAQGVSEGDVTNRLLKLLFFAGAIGNLVNVPGGTHLRFYHRREDADIYLRGKFVLHNALCHAWNIPFAT